MERIAFLAILCCLGCDHIPTAKTAKSEHASAPAIVAFTLASIPRESDSVEPDTDKCENCDGEGKVGDGRIMKTCKVCNGTGKKPASSTSSSTVSQVAAPAPPPLKRLIVHSSNSCPNCTQFMQVEAPKFRAAGFVVEEIKDQEQQGLPVPWFEVDDGKIAKFKAGLTVAGYLTWKATQGE